MINKVDRETANIEEVENSIFDLFCSFNVPESFLEYQTLYGSAKLGFITDDKNNLKNKSALSDMSLALDKIIENFKEPMVEDIEKDYGTFNM